MYMGAPPMGAPQQGELTRPIKLGVQHKPVRMSFGPTCLPQVCQECAWTLALLHNLPTVSYVCRMKAEATHNACGHANSEHRR